MGKFNVGDNAFSLRNGVVVISGIEEMAIYSISTSDGKFTLEGRYHPLDLYPTLLTLDEARAKGYEVPKVKKKVTKEVKKWVNVYAEFTICNDYYSREDADQQADHKRRIACVELTGTYEIEVEE
jgi:hypothetical protein